jgi:phosphopantothenoylcysteine decarboxylase
VLLGLSGSVACVKAPALVAALSAFADVRVVATPAALRFLPPGDAGDAAQQRLAGAPLSTDAAEWAVWRAVGDSVHHIALRRWADVLLVAPLSANSLAKLANGLCDNLLTCVARAWDFRKPLAVAPAMNTAMWDSPFTARVRVAAAVCSCAACVWDWLLWLR